MSQPTPTRMTTTAIPMKTIAAGVVVICLLTGAGLARAADGPARAAVIVGTNAAAAGRQALRFGHRDALAMSEALQAVGGFSPAEIQVLTDPEPATVVAAVKEAARRLSGKPESLIYFYYSGHADDASLYPNGKPLPTAAVREALDAAPAKVKIGIVDACRGGTWTRAKGLSPEEPFAVQWPVGLDSEGSVLIASSSGLESAHESDHIRGSFFTHHFVSALRGAADRNRNGEVTLTEAFEYAKAQTIRDTLRFARETQHPSFHVNLRGRRDLVLARLSAEVSTLEVAQRSGPLELIHAASGVTLLELPEGPREVRLAVPPGAYVVRKSLEGGTHIKEIEVQSKALVRIEEADLVLVGESRLAAKSPSPAFVVSAPVRPAMAVTPTVTEEKRADDRFFTPERSKTLAITSAALSAVAVGLAVKLALDVRKINGDLDPYRRYPCADSAARTCDPSGHRMLRPLTPDETGYALALQDDAYQLEKGSALFLLTGGALAALSVPLFYRWLSAPDDAEERGRSGDLSFGLQLGPGAAALEARLRFP